MALHDFLNSRLGAVFAFQFQELLNVAASFLRVLGNQFQDALFYFGRVWFEGVFYEWVAGLSILQSLVL